MSSIILFGSRCNTKVIKNPTYPLQHEGQEIINPIKTLTAFGPDGRGYYAGDYMAAPYDAEMHKELKTSYSKYIRSLYDFCRRVGIAPHKTSLTVKYGWGLQGVGCLELVKEKSEIPILLKKMGVSDFEIRQTSTQYIEVCRQNKLSLYFIMMTDVECVNWNK